MKKDGNDTLFIVLLVVMVILMCVSFVGLFYMMKEADELRTEVNELKQEKEDDSNGTKCNKVNGKYYGELIDGNLHMKQTYIFNSDGSYTTYVENGGGTNGTYTVTNGTIYFIQKPELGPATETITYFYNISDDCKTITAYAGEKAYKLNLVD